MPIFHTLAKFQMRFLKKSLKDMFINVTKMCHFSVGEFSKISSSNPPELKIWQFVSLGVKSTIELEFSWFEQFMSRKWAKMSSLGNACCAKTGFRVYFILSFLDSWSIQPWVSQKMYHIYNHLWAKNEQSLLMILRGDFMQLRCHRFLIFIFHFHPALWK